MFENIGYIKEIDVKKVYTCFCTDVIHEGHINIINEAKKYGYVIVGVLTDQEMIKYNRFPLKTTDERIEMCKALPGVDEVIVQDSLMYDRVIEQIHPDYIVHGNNWDDDALKAIRDNICSLTKKRTPKLYSTR